MPIFSRQRKLCRLVKDMKKNVTLEIETRLQEKEAEEKARKDGNNIVFGIKVKI